MYGRFDMSFDMISTMWLIMIEVTAVSFYWKPLFAKDSDNLPVLL